MLHVILLILKILGIILLVILGFFLLALYAVFFVAASYRIRIQREEAFQVSASASWCFRILTFRLRQDQETGGEPRILIRLFGFPLWMNYDEPGKKRKRAGQRLTKLLKKWWRRWRPRKKRRPAPPEPPEEPPREPEPEVPDRAESPEVPDRPEEEPKRSEGSEDRDAPEEEPERSEGSEDRDAPEEEPERKRSSFLDRLRRWMRKLWDAFRSVGKAVRGVRDAWKRFLERKDRLLEFWNLEEHRHAREAVMGEVRYLWRKLRPRNVRGRITFGFADPAYTGICMGVAGMLCAWYPKKLEIVPDFDREILEGRIRMKGKARFYVIVRALWSIYRNEDIRHMYRHWQEL